MKQRYTIILLFAFILTAINLEAQSSDDTAVKEIEKILTELSTYQDGEPQYWKPMLIKAMQPVYADQAVQADVEELMIAFLQSDASIAAKKAIYKEFSLIATAASEDEIFELLQDKDLADMSLTILDQAHLGTVKQFKKIMPKVSTSSQIGILNLLGKRKDEQATKILATYTNSDEVKTSLAALEALATIGKPDAAKALMNAAKNSSEILNVGFEEIKIRAAQHLLDNGYMGEAKEIFQDLYESTEKNPVRSAALNGLFAVSTNKTDFIKQYLKRVNPELRSEVIRLVIKLPDDFKDGKEFFATESLSVQDQAQLITVLGNRNDPSINQIVVDYLNQDDPVLRQTALETLPKVGSAEDVNILADLAATLKGKEKQLAEQALYRLPGEKVDQQIIKLLSNSSPEVKIPLIEAVGERNMVQATEVLFELAESDNTKVKIGAIEALGKVAPPAQLEQTVSLLVKSGSKRERRELEDAVYLIAARNPDPASGSRIITQQLNKLTETDNINSLIAILGRLGNPDDFEVLSQYFDHDEPEVRIAVIRAVAEWPTTQPLSRLQVFLDDQSDRKQHALAMKSYLQIVDTNDKLSVSERINKLNSAYQLSANPLEKRMIVASYAKIHEPESLKQLASLMDDREIRTEVEVAIMDMAPQIWERNEQVNQELKKVILLSDNESFVNKVEEEIEKRSQ